MVMINRKFLILCAVSSSFLILGGCTNVRNSLGLEKEAPDEFAVITRAPLEIPSDLTLPPPQPGMPRPQETSVTQKAQEAVLGEKKAKSSERSEAESLLLQKTNANSSAPDIRATVNSETDDLAERNKPVVKKLLKLGGEKQESSATIIDAKKEYERIKNNEAQGKSITDGETPVIEE